MKDTIKTHYTCPELGVKVNTIKKARGTGPLNPSLIFGESAGCFGANVERNFKEQALLCVEQVRIKSNFS